MSKGLILVTGGAGFIGSHTVEALLAAGYKVRVLDDFSSGKPGNLPLHASLEVVTAGICNLTAVQDACKGVKAVVHLAAQVSVPASIRHPARSSQVNGTGFATLVEALQAEGFKGRLVYASSAAVYGNVAQQHPVKEENAAALPLSPYALEKQTNEKMALLSEELYGFSTLGLRFFNVYGPRQDPASGYAGVISVFRQALEQGQPLTIYGDGQQRRDYVAVTNVAEIIVRAVDSTVTGVMNVGTGKAVSVSELAETMAGLMGTSLQTTHADARVGDIHYSCADVTRLKQAFGNVCTTSLQEGLESFLA